MWGALLAGVVAGLGVALPLGAVGTYLVGIGAREPLTTGAAAAFGVATTDAGYALLALAGGTALEQALRPARTPLQVASVLLLVLLAVLTLRTGLRRYRTGDDGRPVPGDAALRVRLHPARAYLTLLGLTAVNPATLTYFTALVVGHGGAHGTHTPAAAAFVVGVGAASASWQLVLVATGRAVGHIVGGRRGRLVLCAVSAGVMAALAVWVAVR